METEIKILDERDVIHFPRPGQPKVVRAATYQIGQGIPRVVYIDKDQFNEESLKAAIRADLEKAPTEGARIIQL